MNKSTIYFSFCLLFIWQIGISQSQTNNLSSSPYSLYGLGVSNEINTGKTNALGKTGIAMPFSSSINSLNPASYGSITLNKFLFDIGIKGETETLFENANRESRFSANFSNMAIAFPLSKNSGFGLTLIPFTNVGYEVLGVETEIDGSIDTFLSNISGSGGLNDLKINYGHSLGDKLRLGLSGSFLFGKIKEDEIDIIGSSVFNISEESFYNGFRIGVGFQYDLNPKISFGGIANLPTKLKGDQTRTIIINGGAPNETENNLDPFKLPLEIGFGMHFKPTQKLFFNLDYKKSFWDVTNQSDLIGDYTDQDFIGFGAEYIPQENSTKYWKRINYRTGFNFDNGNLAIKDNRVNNYALNIGLGLPISIRRNSMLNIGYSYGQKGEVSNGLIKENYHTFTLNFSLEDFWFVKRKYQ
tara:strand:+ start:4432 stop:5670 length:1239 start_codon:yes stop_codon:yes gene_type:complete